MLSTCSLDEIILIGSDSLPTPPRDRHLTREWRGDEIEHTLNAHTTGVLALPRRERSSEGEYDVLYLYTEDVVARCVVAPTYFLLSRLFDRRILHQRYDLLGEGNPSDQASTLPAWHTVRVRVRGWRVLPSGAARQQSVTSYPSLYARITAARDRTLTAPAPRERDADAQVLTPHQERYLNRVDQHIARMQIHEHDRVDALPSVIVSGRKATGDPRFAARDTYTFFLEQPWPYPKETYVWLGLDGLLGQGPRMNGRIKATGTTTERPFQSYVTVTFDQDYDIDQIVMPTRLGVAFSDVTYRMQAQAVATLRQHQGRNPHLLRCIVEKHFRDVPPLPEPAPHPKLNVAQARALTRASATDDLYLVMGPPGTGKTETITALAAHFQKSYKRVLITSKVNRAVDNVLEKLDEAGGFTLIRLGHEGKIVPAVRPLMIDEQARALQAEIRTNTDERFADLDLRQSDWSVVIGSFEAMSRAHARWTEASDAAASTRAHVAETQTSVWQTHAPRVKRAHATLATATARAHRRRGVAALWWRALTLCLRAQDIPALGVAAVALSGALHARAVTTHADAQVAWQTYEAAATAYATVVSAYRGEAQGAPAVLAAKQAAAAAQAEADAAHDRVRVHVHEFAALATTVSLPLGGDADTLEAVAAFIEDTRARMGAFQERDAWRHRLLDEWRTLLERRRRFLQPLLVRAADVIGATCIGISTDAAFRDLDFDVVIADEAGQIQVYDLLVPLVRGGTAILVGDHRQLPPLVDLTLRATLQEYDEDGTDLLDKSLFEILYENKMVPNTRKMMLSEQYRVPEVIADFISRAFYAGAYTTGPRRRSPYSDPFFAHPLCFVDTEHRASYRSRERRSNRPEDESSQLTNDGEARLLAALVCAYVEREVPPETIGVIVPYKNQVQRLREALKRREREMGWPPGTIPSDIVDTVDAFQGNQRPIILFGFTRSNEHGNVGFLRELRRLNVTMTRAQDQLVLIGDAHTLINASDDGFRTLMKALLAYIDRHADAERISVADLEARLRAR